MTRPPRTGLALLLVAGVLGVSACARPEPARQYPLTGQVLSVNQEQQQITIRHDDIPGFMAGMTMSFPVANKALLAGREPGEFITATLEVTGALGRLTTIERTGFAALTSETNAAAIAGGMLKVGDAVPDAAFIDQTNARRSIAQWQGKVTLLTFIYTRCPLPNFCPLMNQHFVKVQQAIAAEPGWRGKVALLTVSFDPEHDTPDLLAAEAQRLGADPAIWTFLTGDRPTVDRFAGALGLGLTRPAGDPEIVHNLRTILIDATGRIAAIYPGNEWQVGTVLDGIRAAVATARVP